MHHIEGGAVPPFMAGGGEMGQRARALAWSATPLGDPAGWPHSLRTTVATLLECKLPMYVAWGPEYIQLYNDAYRSILGDKHPRALGASARETWQEIWDTVGPMWDEVKAGKAIGFDDFKLTIDRYGYREDCYFNFSYSPVRGDHGAVDGVLVTFAETTARVRSERRLRLLDDIAQATRTLSAPADVMKTTAAMLGKYLGVNRCAYAHVLDDEDTFDLIGDYNDGVESIMGRYRFGDFGQVVLDLMRRNQPYVNPDVDSDPATRGTDLSAYRLTRIQAVICVPLHKQGRFVAAMAVHQSAARHWTPDEVELVRTVVDRCWEALERIRADAAVREEAELLEVLNETGSVLAAQLQLETLLQQATDAATRLTGARFGAFFYNGVDDQGEAYLLYTLSGAPREAFERFGHPRPTALFGPTFRGEPPIRLDDVKADARYGQWGPHHGQPPGHLPVRSYLAVPVISRGGAVIGGLFFGHPEVGVFTARSERLAVGVAAQAAIAIDNARLYAQAQTATRERDRLLESERAARQEAERAGTLKDQFLATLSHELRTPLSAILGWVHILRHKLPQEQGDMRRGIDVIERSTRIQVQLIDDLLDMSRITSGKLHLELQTLAPSMFVEAALEVIRPAAEAAGIELTARLDAVKYVRGDAARLQQVVWNLLANSVKFTPPGGRIEVAMRQEGASVRIEISDTGSGIAPEVLPHIFERFRQGDGSITRKHGGLGLGLSIVHDLVALHGGEVEARSAGVGQGTTFIVRLPVSAAAPPEGAGAEAAVPTQVDLSGITVLAVDDEPDARDLLERILREFGATVRLAASAEEALRLFAARPPDILVSDIGMPGMDGFELMRRVRRLDGAGQRVPAIALTAFVRTEDQQLARRAGFDAHVGKPVEPRVLVGRIAAALGLSGRRAESG